LIDLEDVIEKLDRLNPNYRRCMMSLEGQKAPAFSLPGSDGKKHSLADYAGKNIILWFYPKDDTPG
jgi:peroxiredoxin